MRFGIRELIFFVVLLAVPLASFFYVFQPQNEEISRALDEIEDKRGKLDRLHQVTARIDDIGLAIEEGRKSIEVIEAKLPSAQDVEGILEQVSVLAKGNRQNVKKFETGQDVASAGYMEKPLKVIMEGQFDGFYQFLLALEKLERITRIHEMKLERLDTGTGPARDVEPGAMRASFTLSIYFEPRSSQSYAGVTP